MTAVQLITVQVVKLDTAVGLFGTGAVLAVVCSGLLLLNVLLGTLVV